MKAILKKVDWLISNAYVKTFNEKSALVMLLFHGIFKDENEITQNLADPQQKITVEIFKQIIEYYLDHDYRIISTNEVIKGPTHPKNRNSPLLSWTNPILQTKTIKFDILPNNN